jgi:hypothetical protein
VAIWTTTGWTIPANQAVAVNERLTYALVEAQVNLLKPDSVSSLACQNTVCVQWHWLRLAACDTAQHGHMALPPPTKACVMLQSLLLWCHARSPVDSP